MKLWELNQPDKDGCERNTILIKDGRDIVRLRRSLALKKITVLNGGNEKMRLKNFSVGKTLLMPELKKDQIHVIDAETARFFFHTEHYYAAALKQIEDKLKELDTELRRPEISSILDSPIPDEVVPEIGELKKSRELIKNDESEKAAEDHEDDFVDQIRELIKKRDKEKTNKAKTKQ